jgi:hypothetical protein
MRIYDLCIIGGGASGLAAAASLDCKIKACILEKNKILGRKILATGGGRCNITNSNCSGSSMSLDFFRLLGLETYCDDEGRYYPYSNQASDVVTVLTKAIQEKGNVDVLTEFSATKVVASGSSDGHSPADDRLFLVSDGKNQIAAKKLLLAMGGKAGPNFGTTGDGYTIARSFGHTVNKVYPILTGIQCNMPGNLSGIRAKGTVRLYKDNIEIGCETGEIQFRKDGLSGICVMNLSSLIVSEDGENFQDAIKRYRLLLDLAPDFSSVQLADRDSTFGILSEKLAQYVPLGSIKGFPLTVTGVNGWKEAQCTGGGVPLEEVDMSTMESKVVPGLYIAGEMLDYHGPCGGYNLQHAWETGLKAAAHINEG